MNCHKCKSKNCLKCKNSEETYSYRFTKYIDREIPQPDTSTSPQVTPFSDDVEDMLRKLVCTIFDLQPNELLCLKAIINGLDLTEWAKQMETQSKKNQSFTRFRAFQTRKAILKKLGPQFAPALLTAGQKKELKA